MTWTEISEETLANDSPDDSIVIVGGGFTGLFTAMHLSQYNCPLKVKLIDQETRFIFKPLLYELMSGESPVNMVWPRYDELLANRDIAFILGHVESIDLKNRSAALSEGTDYGYRHLVLALGDTTGYFNVTGTAEHTVAFRSANDALALAKRLRHQLQQAQQASTPAEKQRLSTVAIVGAGPTGVELALTLADLLPQWCRSIDGDPAEIRIVLLQRGDEILKGAAGKSLRQSAMDALGEHEELVDL